MMVQEEKRQVYQVIKAAPESIWRAITTPQFSRQYFDHAHITVQPERYHAQGPDDSLRVDTVVLTFDPPRRLVHEWQVLGDPDMAQEPRSRVTWEIMPTDQDPGVCKLTVVHDQPENAPAST